MLEPDGRGRDETGSRLPNDSRGKSDSTPTPPGLSIPKTRSTGSLLIQPPPSADNTRIRFSFDGDTISAAEYDAMARSPVMTEHEHGLGASGLRRIRQLPPPRVPTMPSSGSSSRNGSIGPRSSSMVLSLPSTSRKGSESMSAGPSSPSLNFTEDLTRFPSESLHSFSFTHQSEDFLHNRQNVLKRSIDFMKDRLGWAASNAGIASAQARINGDQEMQSMLELLSRANLAGSDALGAQSLQLSQGPVTGPANVESENVFDKSFIPRSQSPELMDDQRVSLEPDKKSKVTWQTGLQGDDELSDTESSTLGLNLAIGSESSSRTPTNESRTTAKTTPPPTRRQSLKRTFTDVASLSLQHKLIDAMAQPYISGEKALDDNLLSPVSSRQATGPTTTFGKPHSHNLGSVVHGHVSRWAPAAQAIFTTEAKAPWTILAANDLACLVFGVTKAEVRKMGILEVVQAERRAWLEDKLKQPVSEADLKARTPPLTQSQKTSPTASSSMLMGRGGVTAQLLSKPSSWQKNIRRTQTDGVVDAATSSTKAVKGSLNHMSNKSRGVLLCGDVVPIQKRNGATGSASLWVKEKRGGLIWVLEEIHEDVSYLTLDDDGTVTKIEGATTPIWGEEVNQVGIDIGKLLPKIPRQGIDPRTGEIDYAEVAARKYFTARNSGRVNIPTLVQKVPRSRSLRVASFPHIAGIMVLSAETLKITSSNSVFSAALFGQESPDGLSINDLIPHFDQVLDILTNEDGLELIDGIVIPEHSFRRARALLALREGIVDPATFLRPDGLPAKHRDGSEIKIDVQMRVVKSDAKVTEFDENVIEERSEGEDDMDQMEVKSSNALSKSEVVFALWITYSRHLHGNRIDPGIASPLFTAPSSPLHQPSPGQTEVASPMDMDSDEPKKEPSHASTLTTQIKAAAKKTAARFTGQSALPKEKAENSPVIEVTKPPHKKTIDDFIILEDMGQGAYGQVKLARYKGGNNQKTVLKYVTKRRILVDTWTRDRRLGTVPLEIHVLNYLRKEGLKHPNIVEMADFFEDDVNYYIEMVPHGLPGMDLFDYIELRVNMEESECRSIFHQVAQAIYQLHIKARVVHRDIKDENVVLDGEGNIKLIDFGSAAYIKNGPFDVFVGTIDYAAPEVLAGKPYGGKEQDVWALGILLYTIVYKENPFYSIDEIMDRDLRVPYVMSDESIDLIRKMLDRDVDSRIDIEGVVAHPWLQQAAEQHE